MTKVCGKLLISGEAYVDMRQVGSMRGNSSFILFACYVSMLTIQANFSFSSVPLKGFELVWLGVLNGTNAFCQT